MPTQSSTHYEYMSPDYKVKIQHCEFLFANGEVCDEYLGVHYPSDYCSKHRSNK